MDHEGGLDGPGAKSAVHRMSNQLAKAGLPQASEGLASVMVRLSSGSHPFYSDSVMIGIQEWVHHADGCTRQTSHCKLSNTTVFCADAEAKADEGTGRSKVMPACCTQVCRVETDVKRALQAWSQYRMSGKQPAELYGASQPKKHTLASMWGLRAATEGSRKQARVTTGSPACNTRHDDNRAPQSSRSVQGASSAGLQTTQHLNMAPEDLSPAHLKAAELPASGHAVSATQLHRPSDSAHESALARVGAREDAAQAGEGLDAQAAGSDSEPLDSEHALAPSRMIASGRMQSRGSAGQDTVPYPAEPCNGGSSSHSVQCITTSLRAAVQPGHGKPAAPSNALSVLMASSKTKHAGVASPQSDKNAGPKGPAPKAFQQSSWKDALRQVALNPERCACLPNLTQ